MDRFDRIFELHKVLSAARRPVPMKRIMEELECSRATANRIVEAMRLYLGAPIDYDREANGYHYAADGDRPYELPGLWFNASELYALLASQQLLEQVQPGLLEEHLTPLRSRIEGILRSEQLGAGEVAERVRIVHAAARVPGDQFRAVAGALMQRRRVRIRYHGRGSDSLSERSVSPQRLVHYRDNWYLDAWCHLRDGLRSFAVDRIRSALLEDEPAQEVGAETLGAHYGAAYGIFAGPARNWAELVLTAERARWVADERWHPEQQGEWLQDGGYCLRVPFGDPRELVMDILRYGPDVEVLAPEALRELVAQRLQAAADLYGAGRK